MDLAHPNLQQGRFYTAGLSEDEGRQAYLDRLDGILNTEFLQPFVAELDGYRLGSFSVLRLVASARRSTRMQERIAQDRYDAIGVQYVVSGRAIGDAGGRTFESEPGSVMLFDYGQPFMVTDREPRVVVNVAVPRSLFPARDAARFHGMIPTGPAATLLGGFMHGLGETLNDLPARSGPPLAQAFTELLIAALGFPEAERAIDRNAWLIQRAERLVDDRIGSTDLDPAWLAAKLNLSRSELYSVLERFGGVARFIMQRRLRGALAALRNPADGRRIGTIAYAFGFSSEAHFSRTFRAAFGMTASTARSTKADALSKTLDN